jgi:hypothetical protein
MAVGADSFCGDGYTFKPRHPGERPIADDAQDAGQKNGEFDAANDLERDL